MISSNNMTLAAGALKAQSQGLAVTAHNVANVSTGGFRPRHAAYATGPEGFGVRLNAVLPPAEAPDPAQAVYDVTANAGLVPSGTDLAVGAVEMISAQHAYAANAQAVRTADAMLGTLLDIRA